MMHPILVTGAAGRVGGVGGLVIEALRRRGLPVRALVRRHDDRADALRATGTEVVVADLTRAGDVLRALEGCRRMYFSDLKPWPQKASIWESSGCLPGSTYIAPVPAPERSSCKTMSWRCSRTIAGPIPRSSTPAAS